MQRSTPPSASLPAILRYGLALAAVAAVTIVLVVIPEAWHLPVAFYLFAVIVAAWFGGVGPGVTALALADVACVYLLPPGDSGPGNDVLARFVLFSVLAALMVWMVSVERRALASLQLVRDELRRSCDALTDSERKLKAAEGLANIGYWHLEPGGSVHWSEETARIFGRGQPVLTEAAFLALIHPEDRQRRADAMQAALENRGRYDVEYRILRPDGEVRYVHSREHESFGKPGRFGTVQDITERKHAELALLKSERLLREAQALGHTGSWESNLVTGEVINSEENLRLFFGDDRSKGARVEDFVEAVHPEDRAYVVRRREQLLAEGGPPDIEFRVVWPDGSVHVLQGLATIVHDESGKAVRMYGTNLEITERKRAELTERENRQLLEQMLATLPVGVVVVDQAGDVVLSNQASRRIWGEPPIASGERRWEASKGWWHESREKIAASEWASVRALKRGETSLNELIDIETYDGRRKTIQNSSAPIRNAAGAIVGAVVVNEDVSVRVTAEHALRESARHLMFLTRRLLKVQEDERRNLARELHDESGQLLATIGLKLHTLLPLAGAAAQPGLEESMALLQRAGAQLRGLALELRPTMLESAGADAALRWLAEQHRAHTSMPTDVVGHLGDVPGDIAIACFRMVQEALTNVVRHAQAHRVRIELAQTDSAIEITISDDGVGFDPAKVVPQAAERGSLGLLGMKERVQILGGVLDVSSQPGHGTHVRVSIPRAAPAELATEPATESAG